MKFCFHIVRDIFSIQKKLTLLTVNRPGDKNFLFFHNSGFDFLNSVGNFYKWVYTARSSAFLWVSPSHRDEISPLITSNHDQTTHHQFAYLGTRDYSSFYVLPTAIQFYEEMGGVVSMLIADARHCFRKLLFTDSVFK